MRQLTPEGQRIVEELAQRYGFSPAAVTGLLYALLEGHGAAAQFDHPEFAGAGQWMRGGMIMVADMFNNALKARIDGLCYELSDLLASQSSLNQAMSGQFQHQGSQRSFSTSRQGQDRVGPGAGVSLFVPSSAESSGSWWPGALGVPAATGIQNRIRYAYFPASRRLAVQVNGRTTVYDTLDHRISGVSQQQAGGSSLTFTSQQGLVEVAELPVVSSDEIKQPPQASATRVDPDRPSPEPAESRHSASGTDIFAALERLAELKERGILTEEEFSAKKIELLGRL